MEKVGINLMNHLNPHTSFWSGKRVLITGHTGFKGSWLALWLQCLGAEVSAIALLPSTSPNLFTLARVQGSIVHRIVDLRDSQAVAFSLQDFQPEIVFHLAAQALVRESYRDPTATFSTNVQGTVNLLEAVRLCGGVRVVVAVTTDKVYENLENIFPFRETDTLGGHDPYSASKAASEIVISSYRRAFLDIAGTSLASARAGNVIGGGDWAPDRLIPDAIRAWCQGRPLKIRSPEAIRPWQHVLEPLSGYLTLAQALWDDPKLADAYNFGPNPHEASTVRTLVDLAQERFGCGEIVWGNGNDGPHEAGWLSLETAKARRFLGVSPRWDLSESVRRSVDWYKALHTGADARELCLRDIASYESALSTSSEKLIK